MTSDRTARALVALGLTALLLPLGCGEPRRGGDGPIARFVGVSKAQPGQALTFDASDTAEGGLKMSHTWDFGDDSRVVVTFDAIAEHTYDEAGEYTVTLTVTDDLGNTGATSHGVEIAEGYEGCDGNIDCLADSDCIDRECRIRPEG